MKTRLCKKKLIIVQQIKEIQKSFNEIAFSGVVLKNLKRLLKIKKSYKMVRLQSGQIFQWHSKV